MTGGALLPEGPEPRSGPAASVAHPQPLDSGLQRPGQVARARERRSRAAGGRLHGNEGYEAKARRGQRAGPTGSQDPVRLLLAAATRKEGASFSSSWNCENSPSPDLEHWARPSPR